MCGEKDQPITRAEHEEGSPPRMRGKAGGKRQIDFAAGITPACVGKRVRRFMWSRPFGDHPRVCGEKNCIRPCHARPLGSPLRVRGKEGDELGLGQTIRITPACAGKRPGWADSGCQRGDHPRACGEKCAPDHEPVQGRGITPACAGKRSPGIAFFVPLWDHPRVCGEKRSWEAANFRLWGSPPRMRGKAAHR